MDHWSLNAQRWALLGPPLRPSPEDTAFAVKALARWGNAPARAMVLGVTPELVTLPWPARSNVYAIDRVRPMIDVVFPAGPGRQAIVADWCGLPLAARAIDVAVGDGCLTTFAFPSGYRRLAAELARVVDAFIVLRVFVAPDRRETIEAIVADLERIATFDALKWRIAATLNSKGRNVRLVDIRAAFDATFPDRDALAARTGWPRAVIDHIDVYRDSPATYSFPTLTELRDAVSDHLLELACDWPAYALGDRFPTLVFRVRELGPSRRPSRSPTIP
jgi:hypothetical protein